MKLPRISSLDLNERAAWCQKYSTGTEKLGAIVYRIFMERDAHWSAVTIYTLRDQRPVGRRLSRQAHRQLPGSFRPLSAMEQSYVVRGSMGDVIGNVMLGARMVNTVARTS